MVCFQLRYGCFYLFKVYCFSLVLAFQESIKSAVPLPGTSHLIEDSLQWNFLKHSLLD